MTADISHIRFIQDPFHPALMNIIAKAGLTATNQQNTIINSGVIKKYSKLFQCISVHAEFLEASI